jgi:hypothetical protein
LDDLNEASRRKLQLIPEPILITHEAIILSGVGSWRLALLDHKRHVSCIEYNASEEASLQYILASHRALRKRNNFILVCLALRLEPYFQQKALQNMREGGKHKGSSNLTKAQSIDTRSEIGAAAGVSQGTVAKVKQVLESAHPDIQHAVRTGEMSIHMAWKLSRLSPQQQLKELEQFRNLKGTNLTSRRLIQKHVATCPRTKLFPPTLGALLKPWTPGRLKRLERIAVTEIDAPGNVAYLTREAIQTLETVEETICETKTC